MSKYDESVKAALEAPRLLSSVGILKRERDEARAMLVQSQIDLINRDKELESLRADKERLDWMDRGGYSVLLKISNQYGLGVTVRQTIDAARGGK